MKELRIERSNINLSSGESFFGTVNSLLCHITILAFSMILFLLSFDKILSVANVVNCSIINGGGGVDSHVHVRPFFTMLS